MQASEAKARHLCLRPLVTLGRAGGVAASHETEQAPDAPWGWRTRRRESQRRSHELCRKSRCCPPSPCEVGGLCAGAYKRDVTSPVGTSACGVRACMRGVLAGMRARNHGHAPRAATMLPGAEAMPISFCNIVPASPHIHECHRQPGSDQDASTVLLQVHENTGAAWNGPAAMRNSARRASPLLLQERGHLYDRRRQPPGARRHRRVVMR